MLGSQIVFTLSTKVTPFSKYLSFHLGVVLFHAKWANLIALILWFTFSDGTVTAAQLADLPIRRGAGALATQTRLGAPLASRIATFFTSIDPDDLGAS